MGYIDHVLIDAPYAYWPCQETSGAQIKDVVGAKHITFNNAAPSGIGPGIIGADRSWLGTTTAYGTVGFSWSPTAFSVEWWNNPIDALNYQCPLAGETGQLDAAAGSGFWNQFVFHGHTAVANGFFCGTDVPTRFTAAQTAPNYANGWTFWTFTYDGTNGRIYKNGSLLLGPQAMTAPIPWTGMTLGLTNPSAYYFYGHISHLAIHGQALSAARIGARYRERLRGGVSY